MSEVLAKEIKRGGFIYREVYREPEYAIYSQHDKETDRILSFEVFRIIIHKEYKLGDAVVAGGEGFPGNAAFGFSAYSVNSKERAFEKLKEMKAHKEKIDEQQRTTGKRRGRPPRKL